MTTYSHSKWSSFDDSNEHCRFSNQPPVAKCIRGFCLFSRLINGEKATLITSLKARRYFAAIPKTIPLHLKCKCQLRILGNWASRCKRFLAVLSWKRSTYYEYKVNSGSFSSNLLANSELSRRKSTRTQVYCLGLMGNLTFGFSDERRGVQTIFCYLRQDDLK